jgi:DNA polymerase I
VIRPEMIKPVWKCKDCSLHKFATRPVWGRGPQKPLFILVGEGPGKQEDENRMPFYPDAPAGRILSDILKEIGVNRKEIYITNATRCFKGWPTDGGGSIGVEHIKACKKHLTDELSKLDCEYIVPVGNEALKSILGHQGITKEHGKLQVGPDDKKYFPILHPASALPSRTPENKVKIRDALKELTHIIRGGGNVIDKLDCRIITDSKSLHAFKKELDSLPEDTLVIFDYETNSVKSPFHIENFIISGASFAWDEKFGYYLPLDHKNPANIFIGQDYALVKEIIAHYATTSHLRKGAQNAKYEYNVTRGAFGVRLRKLNTDTMLMSHLLRPEPGTHGLDKLAWRVGMGGYDAPLEKWFIDNKIPENERDYTMVPIDILGRYSIADSICTLCYHNKYFPKIVKRKQEKFYTSHVVAAVPAYADMEARGMLADRDYMRLLNKFYRTSHKLRRRQLIELLANEKIEIDKEFNFESHDQVGQLFHNMFQLDDLYNRKLRNEQLKRQRRNNREVVSKDAADYVEFKSGGILSISKNSISGLTTYYDLTDNQRNILNLFREYRSDWTRYTRNVKGLRKYICFDGRLRSSLLMHGTGTSRRSSKDPNQQNIPRDAVVKRIFIAPQWFIFVMNDYRNLEVRIAACKSGDKALLALFNSGKDVHSYLGSRAYKIKYDDFMEVLNADWETVRTKEKLLKQHKRFTLYRNRAKVVWWVLLFGGGPQKIADGAGISFSEAAHLQQTVYAEFPKLREMFEDFSDFADDHGYSRTDFGRRRYLDGISSTNDAVHHAARRQGLNTPIQGTAADITLKAVRLLWREWIKRKIKAYTVQEVHDSATTEAHYRHAYDVITRSREIMENITCPSSVGKIKFEVDTTIGSHLGSKIKVTNVILDMAKNDPKELYRLCRKDLNHPPEYYV